MERNTAQRRVIQQVLQDAGRPLSTEEVLVGAKSHLPSIGIATIYRAMREFAEEGWVTPVQLPGGVTRYEVAGKEHHHYFLCRGCDRTFDVDGCPGNLQRFTPSGFTLERHEVLLYGLCDACSAKKPSVKAKRRRA